MTHVVEQMGLEGTLTSHPVQPLVGKGAQMPFSTTLSIENLQQRGLHHIPEEVVPANDCRVQNLRADNTPEPAQHPQKHKLVPSALITAKEETNTHMHGRTRIRWVR